MSLSRDSSANLVGQAFTVAALAAGVVVLTRYLGPAGKGAYSLTVLIPGILVLIGSMGLAHANVVFLGRGEHPSALATNTLAASIVISICLAALFTITLGVLQPLFFNGIARSSLLIAAWTTPFQLVVYFFSHFLLFKNNLQYNIVVISQFVLPSSGFMFLAFSANMSFERAVWAYALGIGVTSILALVLSMRYVSFKFKFLNSSLLRKALGFGIKAHLFSILQFLNFRFDLLLVAYFLPLTEVGYYSVAVAIAEVVTRVPNAISLAIFPAVSKASAEEAADVATKASRNTLFLVTLLLLGLTASGHFVVTTLFGKQFTAILPALWWLFPGMLSVSLLKILLLHATGQGKPELGAYATAAALVISISLDIVLIPRWGIVGAALTSSISYSIATMLMVWFFLSDSKRGVKELMLIKSEDISIYASALSRLVKTRTRDRGAKV